VPCICPLPLFRVVVDVDVNGAVGIVAFSAGGEKVDADGRWIGDNGDVDDRTVALLLILAVTSSFGCR
jgi:hypothetical protein